MTDRFWDKVDKISDPNGCWVWTAARTKRGYGAFRVGDRGGYRAHRFSYEMCVGPIPEGLQVNHHCDNPSCVNPAHLYIGTQLQNRRDAVQRGRTAKGDANGMSTCPDSRHWLTKNVHSKLTSDQYEEVFRMYLKGSGYAEIGRRFQVSRQSIYSLIQHHPGLAQKGA